MVKCFVQFGKGIDMSRIGKLPIEMPKGIEVKINGNVIEFKSSKHTRSLDTLGNVVVKLDDGKLVFSPVDDSAQSKAFWGTYRVLANNIAHGLSEGFEKKLEVNGVGYRVAVKGSILELILGYSHPINYEIPKDIEIVVDKNIITVKGVDKQLVGQVAANIREFRPPEPYKGKGVKYVEETIVKKAGKTAKK